MSARMLQQCLSLSLGGAVATAAACPVSFRGGGAVLLDVAIVHNICRDEFLESKESVHRSQGSWSSAHARGAERRQGAPSAAIDAWDSEYNPSRSRRTALYVKEGSLCFPRKNV
jgi:hypothetical protein